VFRRKPSGALAALTASLTSGKAERELPPIVQVGDPVLRARALAVPPEELTTDAFRALVATMV
jgi:hypothetical protein